MQLLAEYDGPIAARVWNRTRNASQGQLTLFDLRARLRLRDLPVVYRPGGRRCDLSRDNSLCFIGCYETHGLAAYSTNDGSELWRRQLQALQSVVAFRFDDVLFCRCQDDEALLLCPSTGRTLDVHHGVQDIYPSAFSNAAVVTTRTLELHQPFGTCRAKWPRTTFAELDCAFSETEAVVTESGGPVRCFDLASTELLWSHIPRPNTHFVDLSFCKSLNCFAGIRWDLENTEAVSRLLHFDPQTGAVLKDLPLNQDYLYRFCLAGTQLFTQHLRLLSVQTGDLLHQFDDDP